MSCPHSKLRSITVFLHPDDPMEAHRAVVTVRCEDCGAQFRFADGPGALAFNDQRTELSAWIVEAEKSAPEAGLVVCACCAFRPATHRFVTGATGAVRVCCVCWVKQKFQPESCCINAG